MSVTNPVALAANEERKPEIRGTFNKLVANEWVFAVVGPVGSGTSFVAAALEALAKTSFRTTEVFQIKASKVIKESMTESEKAELTTLNKLDIATRYQNAGDSLRKNDASAVAVKLMSAIKAQRALIENSTANSSVIKLNSTVENEIPTRVFIIDSLKHPAEVELLRGIYRESFCLIGVVCEAERRKQRLQEEKFQESSLKDIKIFMQRDESDTLSYGQKVTDTFHLSDFFVDNTPARYENKENTIPNKEWIVSDKLGRLFDILTFAKIIRPDLAETGMFHAKGAQLRSACLSRQVGAALTDSQGNIIATGTNEVPMAGGGVYGGNNSDLNDDEQEDHRCFKSKGYCSNTQVQKEIISEVINKIPQLKEIESEVKEQLAETLKKTQLGRLIEFSRAVHAEMDALLTAARIGTSTVACKLFVTTFPCHYCARHIVAAGVDEVQYIEPYPKSRAFDLHDDAIQPSAENWLSPSKFRILVASGNQEKLKISKQKAKVLFKPFTGVAPRLYRRAFFKDIDLKDKNGNFEINKSNWERGLLRDNYREIENILERQANG